MNKFIRFQTQDTIAYGLVEDDLVRKLDGDLFASWEPTSRTYNLSDVKLLVPSRPGTVLAVARNYKSHLFDEPAAENPELFFKVPSCLIAHGENVVIPSGTAKVDAEAELVLVIGRRARNVPVDKALDYVLGVTCGNDVSARDWQQGDTQWWRAKGSDTFGPCGPCIVQGIDYDDLLLQLRHGGEVRQRQRTRDMIHGPAALISWASRHLTLLPGDLIYTGTPGTTPTIKSGDVVEVELEGVGVLRNPVTAAQ